MTTIINTPSKPRNMRFAWSLTLSLLFLLGIMGSPYSLQAQMLTSPQTPTYTRPSWWFGVAGAGNINFYRGSTKQLTADLESPVAFHNGLGLGLYVAPLVEFHRPTSNWGFNIQAAYDSRRGTFATQLSPCNCPRDLATKVAYVALEPSIRFAPFKGDFYLFGGPRVAYNVKKSFVYKQGTNPDYPEQIAEPDVLGDLSEMKPVLISGKVGMGYDFHLTSQKHPTQWIISPFASFQPYFGQSPRLIETWNMTTLRVGAAIKFGRGREIVETPAEVVIAPPVVVVKPDPEIQFTTNSPANVQTQSIIREVFPLRNHVYFDRGSTKVPNRYVMLRKNQVEKFEEGQVELYTPTNLSGRADRQMIVYYNLLNILGERMLKNPSTSISLVGSSEQGPADGLAMATSIQTYLVDIWGIGIGRIKVEGRSKPEHASVQPGSDELILLNEGDRRVTIESASPLLLMEFTSGPGAPLKPVMIVTNPVAPVESYMTFDAKGSDKLASWRLEITDETGAVQYFGPYTDEKVSIPGNTILGARSEGDYTVTMIGETKTGNTITESNKTHIVRWTPPQSIEVMRFSVIYDFDESKATSLYDKYLTEVVVPKISNGGKVIIHGFTDEIGEVDYNMALSKDRAENVMSIIQKGLAKAGIKDVKFEAFGFGEDPNQAQFNNSSPEGRSYNRTVVIDVLPK